MLYYDRIHTSEGIDINKSSILKERMLCCYWYFLDISNKYGPKVHNGAQDISRVIYELKILQYWTKRTSLTLPYFTLSNNHIGRVKRDLFIDWLQISQIEFVFGKIYIWSLLYRKCLATRMGLPWTCHCDITKADQWRFYISRTIYHIEFVHSLF